MRLILFSLCLLPLTVNAASWTFTDKIAVTKMQGEKVYHHLDSTGRNNIAIAGDTLAVSWEDNHTGTPQVYVAFKHLNDKQFAPAVQVSQGKSAYAPVIRAYDRKNFLISWEQDGYIWLRLMTANKASNHPAIKVSKNSGRQSSFIALNKHTVMMTWSDLGNRISRVVYAQIKLDKTGIPVSVSDSRPIDPDTAKAHQIYPSLSATNGLVTLIWEDRRHGHTILLYRQMHNGKTFGPVEILNEVVQKSSTYGRGNGVTRAALSNFGQNGLAVTWMDKRAFSTGYDIYAASYDHNKQKFGINQQVQDNFGNNIAQWNPTITGNQQGDIVIAWDDNRDESSDIWFAYKTPEGWSEDIAVDPASGAEQQFGPAIMFDQSRNLHIIWLESAREFGATKLYYATGTFNAN